MANAMTIGVVGAGTMGSGIAQKLAQEGLRTILLDLDERALARGMERIARSLDEAIERRIIAPEQKGEILGRIEPVTAHEALAEAELVIEAVFEDLEVKRNLFRRLAAVCRPDAVLATNTSSFYVRDLAAVTDHPERVVGLHYFYHPAKNRLVEVVPHAGTDERAYRRAWVLQERIGKTPIRSADAPGFVVNRYFVPWLNEAVRLLEEGLANVATIEAVAKARFGVGMGPFELMNVTGVPIALHAATTLGRELGPLYAPSARLAAQVEAGSPWPLEGEVEEGAAEAVAERLFGIVFHVAAALVDEGVATIEDTDIGARVGLRWPKGPFERMNEIGVAKALAMAERACARFDVAQPRLLREQAASGEPFRIERARLEVERGIGTITLNRPDALNALDEALMADLRRCFEAAAADPRVGAIALRGAGKAFVAGADVRWFVEQIEAGRIDRIVAFTRKGHELLAAIRACPKPVIAVLDGLSLGGGSELALACDQIIGTDRASMGFPETGIGIYPGLGGTQNLPRRVGRGLARYLIYTGRVLGAADMQALGLLDRLVDLEKIPAALEQCAAAGKPPARSGPAGELPAAWAARAACFDVDADAILEGKVQSEDPALLKELERVRKHKAPLALRAAARLTERALETPYTDGLAAELAGLEAIFASADALTGLRSVLERSRPRFEGR